MLYTNECFIHYIQVVFMYRWALYSGYKNMESICLKSAKHGLYTQVVFIYVIYTSDLYIQAVFI